MEVVGSGNTSDSEIADYLLDKNSSPFIWWSANYNKCPNLGQLAKRDLSEPMGSVLSKREFKQVKRVVTGRWNLKARAENIKKLLFLMYKLRMIGYDY